MWDHVRTVRRSHHPLRLFVAKVHFVEFQWCFALWHHAIGCEISQLWSIMETIGNRLLCVHSLATDEDTSAPVFGFSFILFYSILCCVSPCFPCRHKYSYRLKLIWMGRESSHRKTRGIPWRAQPIITPSWCDVLLPFANYIQIFVICWVLRYYTYSITMINNDEYWWIMITND